MTKKLFILLLALVGLTGTMRADVVINATNFPDADFRDALINRDILLKDGAGGYGNSLNIAADGVLTDAELAQVTGLLMSSSGQTMYNITDLTGIEYFTN